MMVALLAERCGWTLPQIMALNVLQAEILLDRFERIDKERAKAYG
jgi:hypothetical protein